jgi:hypothetical protein
MVNDAVQYDRCEVCGAPVHTLVDMSGYALQHPLRPTCARTDCPPSYAVMTQTAQDYDGIVPDTEGLW